MTETEWLSCAKPTDMLAHLRGRWSPRKLRLFVCACCRRIWDRLTHPSSQTAVEVAERYAEGAASDEELASAWRAADAYFSSTCVYGTSTGDQPARAASTAAEPEFSLIPHLHHLSFRYLSEEFPAQADILRDQIGEFVRPASVELGWLTPTVVALATGIYADRAFDRMPILADALEESGCDHAELLAHCRGPGPHVRGCWVVDMLLGKE